MSPTPPPRFQDFPEHAAQLIDAALAAVNPAAAVKRHLRWDGRSLNIGQETYDLEQGRVLLISVGKAAVPMGLAAVETLDDLLSAAIFIAKETSRDWREEIKNSALDLPPATFSLFLAGHPIPNESSLRAGAAVLARLGQTSDDDLVLFLISGGASSLLAQPLVPLADWQKLTSVLLTSGCTINELNCVRRQLDGVKGGGLVRAAAPTACASLILSDVIGNPLAIIGSGPTVIDDETADDALAILTRYQIARKLETIEWRRLNAALLSDRNAPRAQPGPNQHLIVGDVRGAAEAAMTKAAQLGFVAQILTTRLEGEAREVGRIVAALAKDTPDGRCLILGGETTVSVRGRGKGGRNQELALAAAVALADWPHRVIICFASDGEDGPTEAAGAIVTGETAVTARQDHDLNPVTFLDNNDSYTFFHRLDLMRREDSPPHHIRTGSTGTNVNDLLIILTYAGNDQQVKETT